MYDAAALLAGDEGALADAIDTLTPELYRYAAGILLSTADAADAVHVLGTNNSAGCMMQRNRAMVDASAYVIAYYDPATQTPGVPPHGGTFRTIEYACSKRVPVTNLHDVSPDELPFRPEWYEPED